MVLSQPSGAFSVEMLSEHCQDDAMMVFTRTSSQNRCVGIQKILITYAVALGMWLRIQHEGPNALVHHPVVFFKWNQLLMPTLSDFNSFLNMSRAVRDDPF